VLASALVGNSSLTSLDLCGCTERDVRDAFGGLLGGRMGSSVGEGGEAAKGGAGDGDEEEGRASATLSVTSGGRAAPGEAEQDLLLAAGSGLGGGGEAGPGAGSGARCALASLRCSGEDYEVIDLVMLS
jgi:hypothetical protein